MSLESLSAAFTLDRSRSATSQVYEFLRELIVTLALEPGTPLSRTQVAERLNLSPMPVREALSQLEKEGLVEIFPQHLTRVRGIDVDSARQVHVLRLAVELEIVFGLAKNAGPAVAKALLATVTKQRACLEVDDFGGFITFDQEFHLTMYREARLMNVWHMIRGASGNLDRLRRLHVPLNGKAQAVLEQHTGIARAISEGNAAEAQDWVRQHLSGTLAELDSLRERYPDYMLPMADFVERTPA
ncbi:DNA-binding GntR family transcriptional regulator [Pseudoduganella lurida]|uniref:DNA-binding GntR family transcriptional regulator n=1 Tax=Pseudoduganella lurida TaxID=1036180 RepID=A0A562RFU9_9BURK|nr:GntR family transcriptional regulator [Pseudoduganella lurida]TWI67444.1 DNA-binding GntR family transcriptional regulator [Pseudoduganella lurida]